MITRGPLASAPESMSHGARVLSCSRRGPLLNTHAAATHLIAAAELTPGRFHPRAHNSSVCRAELFDLAGKKILLAVQRYGFSVVNAVARPPVPVRPALASVPSLFTVNTETAPSSFVT